MGFVRILFIFIFLITTISAQTISLDYDSPVLNGQEISFKLQLIDFESGIYDIKIDIFGNGERIAKILNGENWKSAYYFVNSAISTGEIKNFLLKIDTYVGDANIIVKIRKHDQTTSISFEGYNIAISGDEIEEAPEDEPGEDPPNEPIIEFNETIEPEKLPKKDTSMNWLYEDKTKDEKPSVQKELSSATSSGKNIRELYGSKFGELSQAQQEYILDNQEIMRRITQQVLTRQASVSNLSGLNVNKTNVIEFYLWPNGDKTDFKFLSKSGYFILDEITRVTIEYAYSKYPRPKEKTLIRYNVFYNLKHY